MKELIKHELNKERNRLHAEFECVCDDPRCKLVPGIHLNYIIEMGCNNGSFYTDEYSSRREGRKEMTLRIDDVMHTFWLKKMHCGNCGTIWYYAWTPEHLIVHTEYESIHNQVA